MIIPRKYDYIKHKEFRDVACMVHSFKQYSSDYYTVKIQWVNQGFTHTWTITSKETLKIPVGNLKDWVFCPGGYDKANTYDFCLRYEKWLPIIK